jgi:quercetin dioxygenase-like cupin family protein
MELVRYDAANTAPLDGGSNAVYLPIQKGERLIGMMVQLERKGDTGKREVGNDVILVVLSGEGRLRSGGEIADLRPGDVCVLPGGLLHQIWTADSRLQAVMVTVGA